MNDTLSRWLDEGAAAARIVAEGAGFGRVDPADTEGMTGQQILEAMMAGQMAVPLNAAHLCYVVLQVGDGKSMLQAMPQQCHLNPMGTVFGGWLASLMDVCMGNAIMSKLPADRIFYATSMLSADFVSAVPEGITCVRCEAHVDWVNTTPGGTLRTLARIVDADGKVYALGQGAFRVSRRAFSC